MSPITAERKQATIPNQANQVSEELVEQVIYIFQNHLAPMVESTIRDRVEKYESRKPSTNTDNLLTRNEFLTAMQLMDKRFEDINKRFEDINKRFEDQSKYMEKRFEDINRRFEEQNKYMEKRFEDVNKRFEEQKENTEKLFQEQKEYTEKLFQEQKENTMRLFEATNKRFEDVNKRFEDVNKRFEDQKQYMDKRFNAVQWTIGIGFTILTSLMVTMLGLLNTVISSL